MVKFIRLFNILSFDTAFGALSFALIISYAQLLETNYFSFIALFISVLSIYNIDHLLDATKLKGRALSYRHGYYQRNIKALISWQILLTVVGIIVLFYIPVEVIVWGGVSLLCIGIYFLVIFRLAQTNLIFREVIVALGYTLAVSFVPFVYQPIQYGLLYIVLVIIIFFIALTNLLVFSIYDIHLDKIHNHHSVARSITVSSMRVIIKIIIFIILIIIMIFTIVFNLWLLGASLILIELIYLVLLENQAYFKKNEYYRLIGEFVLILPGLMLLLSNAI